MLEPEDEDEAIFDSDKWQLSDALFGRYKCMLSLGKFNVYVCTKKSCKRWEIVENGVLMESMFFCLLEYK